MCKILSGGGAGGRRPRPRAPRRPIRSVPKALVSLAYCIYITVRVGRPPTGLSMVVGWPRRFETEPRPCFSGSNIS